MPQPLAYNRAFDFGVFAPATVPEHGARTNTEFDRIAASVAGIRGNLALIQRDDGAPANSIVTLDTLAPTVRTLMGGWTPRGGWVTATPYAARDFVVGPDDLPYICVVGHTSGVFATDKAANRWQSVYADAAALNSLATVLSTGSSVVRTLADRFATELNVLDYGAITDGTGDNSTAFGTAISVAAARGGGTIFIPEGDYRFTAGVTVSATGVRFRGTGEKTIIRGVGSFDTFTFTGGSLSTGIENVSFQSALKTGGYDVKVNSAFRCTLRNLIIFNTYGGLDFSGALSNQHEIIDVQIQSFRGPIAINWQGTNGAKVGGSDMYQVRVGETSYVGGGTALNIDGDVASLNLWGFFTNGAPAGASNLNYGVRVHNTIGATLAPRFINGVNVQCEFAKIDGVRLDAGEQITFLDLYASAAIENGVTIANGVEKVSLVAPYIVVNGRHGVYHAGRDLTVAGGVISGNSQAGAYADNRGDYDGVHCAATCIGASLVGTRIGFVSGLSQRFGVYGAAGAQLISVSGCNLNDNMLAGARDDTAGALGNMRVVGNVGTTSDFIGGIMQGAPAGARGWLTPVIVAGVITGVVIVDEGRHYDSAPTAFVFDRGGGTGASITVNVAGGRIIGATIGSGGSGYSANTKIYLRPATTVGSLRAFNTGAASAELRLRSQNLGVVTLGSEQGTVLTCTPVASTVNQFQMVGSATGTSPELRAIGDDANLDLRLVPKGTGLVRFGTLTVSADAPVNGYIEIKTAGGGTVKLATIA